MKKYTCIGLICAAVLTMGACTNTDETENLLGQNQETKAVEYVTVSVTLTEAGTLKEHIGSNANTLEKLVISGPIDATDVNVIRSLPRLEAIDMADATIVGGLAVYNVGNSEITLQDNTIGIGMFSGLKLSEIILPNSITGIDTYAFSYIDGYANLEVVIPESVTTLGEEIFYECQNLTSATLPSNITNIPYNTFYGCRNLTNVAYSENITSIGRQAFEGCTRLVSLDLPESLTYLGSRCFSSTGLISVRIPDNVVLIGSDGSGAGGGNLDELESSEGIFYDCTSLISVTLPANSTIIPHEMFAWCSSLTSVVIPNSMTTIEGLAFWNCSSLVSIQLPSNLQTIPEGIFRGCSSLASIDIPESVIEIGAYAFEECTSLTNVSLPDGIIELAARTFYGCSSLNSITLPERIRAIGEGCFSNTGLTSIEFPDRLSSIGSECFSRCYNLKSITITENITSIGEYIVFECPYLTSIFWNTNMDVPSLFGYYEANPNCLLYISQENVRVEDTSIKNIIYNGIADEITLDSRAYGFDVPQEFQAKSISYSMEFASWTYPGWSSGWYTISLPFTVTDIRHEQGRILAPFNADVADAKPFWLRRLTENGFENVTNIEAGIPYIIAMPNNDAYLPEYNIEGWVTFSAQNESGITIPVTQSQILRDQGPRFALINNFDYIQTESETSDYYTLWDGSEFRRAGYTEIYPFTCYAIPNSATAATSLSIESAAPATRSAKPLGPIPSIDDM